MNIDESILKPEEMFNEDNTGFKIVVYMLYFISI